MGYGGGGTWAGDNLWKNVQVCKPPYLFKSSRPGIQGVPINNIANHGTFTVTLAPSTSAGNIQRAVLVKSGSVTHGIDTEQRRVEVDNVSRNDSTLTLRGPNTARLATPRFYMMFVLDQQAVPCAARVLNFNHGNRVQCQAGSAQRLLRGGFERGVRASNVPARGREFHYLPLCSLSCALGWLAVPWTCQADLTKYDQPQCTPHFQCA